MLPQLFGVEVSHLPVLAPIRNRNERDQTGWIITKWKWKERQINEVDIKRKKVCERRGILDWFKLNQKN